ncbi:hypothetical protein HHI36_023674 [Cryptolaemus montrouzieri]|uniref:Uncharacterized protein n=1 Tax=Cryptolaemus montrouzieri TaxID=559131 RepID=A0ABD2PJH8_9CUCU
MVGTQDTGFIKDSQVDTSQDTQTTILNDLLKEKTNLKNENELLRKLDFNREEQIKLIEFRIGVLEDTVVETKKTDAEMTLHPKNRLNIRRNLSSWRNRDSTHLTTQNNILADFMK